METNTYTILEEKREELAKKLARIEKKAQKYKAHFSASFGDPYAMEIKHRDEETGKTYVNKYEVFDLTVESEVVRKGEYTVLARLEHTDNGNIVNVFSGDMNPDWAIMGAYCQHCFSNHNLKYTFIVEGNGERKQVGRTCLKDYCGIDPQMIAAMNEFYEEMEEYGADRCEIDERTPCVYDSDTVLALAIEITKAQGYVKSDEFDSNRSNLCKAVSEHRRPSEKAMEEAKEMGQFICSMSVDDAVNAYLNNVQVRLNGLYCKPSDFGYFAYAPTAYAKLMERMEAQKRRDAERKEMGEKSGYVGTVGERSEFRINRTTLVTKFPTEYGMTYLYRFIDENENVLVWFASSPLESTEITKIKGTIKAHNERDGVKQTVITRVKVA